MVPRLGVRQDIKGFLGEYGTEFSEVGQDVFCQNGGVLFGIRGVLVPFEGLRQALRDGGGRSDFLQELM